MRSGGELPGLEARTVPLGLADAVRQNPARPALRDASSAYTYAELAAAVERLVAGLEGIGVGRADRVATVLDNSADHAVVWLALACLGAVGVPVDPALPAGHLNDIVTASQARVVIAEAHHLAAVAGALGGTAVDTYLVRGGEVHGEVAPGGAAAVPPGATVLPLRSLAASGPGRSLAELAGTVRPWDLQSVIFTSGSTGRPKGTLVTQAQTYTRAGVQPMSAPTRVVSMVTLPLFHVVGQCRGLFGALLSGGEAVIVPRFSVRAFWDDVDRYAVTHTAVLGSMARFLMNAPTPVRRTAAHPVTMYMAPAIPEVAEFERRFAVTGISSYGSTEAGTICAGEAASLTCGTLHRDFDGMVVDEHDMPVPAGTPGELVVRPRLPWIMSPGYLDNPEAGLALWRNGWFHTGDYFTADDAGRLTFAGRKKQIIRRRGENINPESVEDAIESHPAVLAAAVVAVPSEHLEDEVKAIVVRAEGAALEPAELLAHLADRLPYFALPRFVEFRTALPMTSNGKLDRKTVQAAPSGPVWDREGSGRRPSTPASMEGSP